MKKHLVWGSQVPGAITLLIVISLIWQRFRTVVLITPPVRDSISSSYLLGKYDPFLSGHCSVRKQLYCNDSCMNIARILRQNKDESTWTLYYDSVAQLIRANGLQGGTFVEVGIGHGGLSAYMLSSFPSIKYHSVDPFMSDYDDNDAMSNQLNAEQRLFGLTKAEFSTLRGNAAEYILSLEAEPCPTRFSFHHRTSTSAAAQFIRESVDVVFIDGLHTEQGVKDDIEAWLFVLKPDGLMIFNDYGTQFPGVTAAVDALAARLDIQITDMSLSNVYIRRPRHLL